jgi:hypothetical protein
MLERRTEDLREHAQNALIWQYESPNYEAASSLSSLSLLAPEVPTRPQPPIPATPKPTRRLQAIDEIDTVPPSALPAPRIAASKALTAPRSTIAQESTRPSVMPAPPVVEPREAASWTAGAGSNSRYARIISGAAQGDWRKQLAFNPLDRLRWWLLRPGRLEFLLWLGGTLLLVIVTCALLFILAFSFEEGSGVATTPAGSALQSAGAASKTGQQHKLPALQVALTRPGPYAPGEQVGVRGQGFSPHSTVSFTLDGILAIQGQDGSPALLPTDARGAFSGTLWLGVGPTWAPGRHTIIVRDKASGRQFALPITLVATLNSSATTQVTPSTSSTTPGVAPSPVSTGTPVVQASPGNQTPVPSTPTPTSTLTPTVTPTVTSTAATSPTPTTSVTATATSTKTSQATPGATPQNSFGSALNQSGDPPIGSPLSTSSPLVWIMAACYTLSMILLGVAGILYKRRPRPASTASSR